MTVSEVLLLIKDQVPTMTAVVGGIWVAFTYLRDKREAHEQSQRQSENEAATRSIEARKPFLTHQLKVYKETAEVAGKLVTTPDRSSAEWIENTKRFEQLFWTELPLVEDNNVRDAMESAQGKLVALMEADGIYLSDTAEQREKRILGLRFELQQGLLKLVKELKASLQNSWGDRANHHI
jgi:hypothetical protein